MEKIEDIRNLPELDANAIHIWGVHVPNILDRIDELARTLSDQEMAKAHRYRRKCDGDSSIAARGALRVLLAGYSGVPASKIGFTYSVNGKPRVSDVDVAFNVSHSGEWVVLAMGRRRCIGVDIEQVKREMDVQSIAGRYFTTQERSVIERSDDPHGVFFRLWARKEAYVKACGSTLFTELSRTSVPLGDGAEMNGWFFHDLKAGSRHAAAVVTDKPIEEMPCYDFGGLKWEN